ncbi:C40 family peptidase [Olivibacter sp. XZL3]|uniref:C40 family peptidase n=1 Tax=Olivibacter sp. XZL3 TaxID=1735116 RepID=UPI001066DF5A|nr:C40 family peptidase [Olivibacter sp. XZL3]
MRKSLCLSILCISLCFFSYASAKKDKSFSPASGSIKEEVTPSAVVAFAKQLLGVPYRFGGSNPRNGFDCSGFVNYVFSSFHFAVPRTSAAFGNEGKAIPLNSARAGDLILFRGTNPKVKSIGHIGIVISEKGQPLRFIHASSGSVRCVTETPLNDRYQKRFIKIVRLLP